MDYGDIEKHAFRTFVAFSSLIFTAIFLFMNFSSTLYRVTEVIYDKNESLNFNSLEKLKGQSIWLIDDSSFKEFYENNPKVESIFIQKDLPNRIIFKVTISEKIAHIQDMRHSPPKSSTLYKSLLLETDSSSGELMKILIKNGPVDEGFYGEIVSFVMTLKKYPVNLANVELTFDGKDLILTHFNTNIVLGDPSDLGRKSTVVGFYLSDVTCEGEIRLVYSENASEIRAVTNCK